MIPKPPQPIGSFVTVNGAKLHYLQTGNGPDLVLLHGASGNLRDWTFGPMGALAKQYRVTAFDRPGLGHSDDIANSPDISLQAKHLISASKILGIEQPIVFGHSYGGAIALAWTLEAQQDVAGLILLSSPSQIWPGGLGWQYDLATTPVLGWLAARVLPALASKKLINGTLSAIFEPQAVPEDYNTHIAPELSLQPSAVLSNARQVAGLKEQLRPMIAEYPRLTLPVAIVHGDLDDVVPLSVHSEPLIKALPNAELTVLEGIGHMPHHTAWPQIAQAIARLQARLPAL